MGNVFQDIDTELEKVRGKAKQEPIVPEKGFFQKGFEFVRERIAESYAEHKSLKEIEHEAFMNERIRLAEKSGKEKARKKFSGEFQRLGEDIKFKGFNTKKLFR